MQFSKVDQVSTSAAFSAGFAAASFPLAAASPALPLELDCDPAAPLEPPPRETFCCQVLCWEPPNCIAARGFNTTESRADSAEMNSEIASFSKYSPISHRSSCGREMRYSATNASFFRCSSEMLSSSALFRLYQMSAVYCCLSSK